MTITRQDRKDALKVVVFLGVGLAVILILKIVTN
jgi:hypothetical protein